MNGWDIQHLTPLMEVLCGFNVAFALWDGFTGMLFAYEKKLASAQEASRQALRTARTKPFRTSLKRDIRAYDQSRIGARKADRVARRGRKWGLAVALAIMVVLTVVGLRPGLGSELSGLWLQVGGAVMLVIVSLAPAAVTWSFVWWKLGKVRRRLA